ncbi:MAG: D-alanyl-D-alanine carboxypeptidase [Clostridiales bacterium]|jgi:D-alanyl-D-alanine carboxypeptidase (penicillin-binding protein 5/6)|nr:D-alanyl-D-alanine carboxypeptidase [Clostridiales bacterium]
MNKLKVVFAGAISLLIVASMAFGSVSLSFAKSKSQLPQDLAKNAKSAVLVDYDTGTVVFDKNPDDRYPIASMVKIMTLLLVCQDIQDGLLTVNTDVAISENAASMGGSQAFLDANTQYKAGELVKSIVVASANDSCVALAEHLSGAVESFVSRMNAKAGELGMNNTNFVNCTGLPAPNGYSSAKDVSTMMRALLRHQLFYQYASVWTFDFAHNSGRTTTLTNTNKLINAYNGCDGGKTGFTQEAKYCLAATAKRGNTRLISVVIGENDSKVRNFEVSSLLNYGFGNYETRQLVFREQPIQDIVVNRARQPLLPVAAKDDYFCFGKKTARTNTTYQVNIEVDRAPISKGQKVGTLNIVQDGNVCAKLDLIATKDISQVEFVDILLQVAAEW